MQLQDLGDKEIFTDAEVNNIGINKLNAIKNDIDEGFSMLVIQKRKCQSGFTAKSNFSRG
jgi:hypothetical protein